MALVISSTVRVIILNFNHIVGKTVTKEQDLVLNSHSLDSFEVFHLEGNAY